MWHSYRNSIESTSAANTFLLPLHRPAGMVLGQTILWDECFSGLARPATRRSQHPVAWPVAMTIIFASQRP